MTLLDTPPGLRDGREPTDLGNARRLVDRHGEDLRHSPECQAWFVWDGRRWQIDRTQEVVRRAKDTVEAIFEEAEREPDERRREILLKHALASQGAGRITSMIRLASSEPRIPVLRDCFDSDAYSLNVMNGTIDLRTGTLREHRRADLMTRLAPVIYNDQAACSKWERFLGDITRGSQEVMAYLQRVAGYALTGDAKEEALFILWGSGANGKSTFLETLRTVLGDYAAQAEFSSFTADNRRGIRNDIARLDGIRLVTASEAEEGRRLSEALVKQLTGRDTATARFLYREFFEFTPRFKPLLATNHRPEIRGTDRAIWRRIQLIPFDVSIPETGQDKDLLEKLSHELPGILAWAVRGCRAWQEQGLAPPEKVVGATEAYRRDEDVVGHFLEDACAVGPELSARAGDLYAAYRAWCDAAGEAPISQKALGARLTERGLQRKRVGSPKVWTWFGIGLVTPLARLAPSIGGTKASRS